MKILHTDKEPANTVTTDKQVSPEEFLSNMKTQKKDAIKETIPAAEIVDLNTGKKFSVSNEHEKPSGKSSVWIWVIIGIIAAAIILMVGAYMKNKRQSEIENTL